MNLTLLFVFGIGFVAGLRSFTAPAVVAWAAYLGWINLQSSPFAFIGSKWAVIVFTILAFSELIADQLPSTPPRTGALGLSARIATGALTGACIAVAGSGSIALGAIIGIAGALAGAFGGYYARAGLVRSLRVPDFVIALPEDAVAIGLGLLLSSRI
ncbi:MAG TPA: DUF4126 family protein [Candidatus Sulfotelmatobacter sp.]|nr:DUF4126 family protein [Candidatus Sulfotelmatobacter sp.]